MTVEMKVKELRDAYLRFFEERGHTIVPSSSLVPNNDPTLLFTNAGMNQFKDALLGREDLGFKRAVSTQRCVRAGGKHNDLENVGYTARHHTFFEMLGNFSFGDYFKNETIAWAWEFATQVLGIPKEKIWVTVHPTDDESRAIWRDDVGVAEDRIIDIEDNFWTMGDTGPCGPCTELFYDHGPEVEGGPPGSPEEDGDRYIEFWNLVFPQFDRSADGTLNPLPQHGVDTGMGLERVAAILQHVHSNYETDLFRGLMLAAGRFAGITEVNQVLANASLRVIADHIRSSAFLIADGVMPGNEGRAYVLRRIIRRALRHANKLGIDERFFHKLVDPLIEEMGEAFPLLVERRDAVAAALLREEERFAETLSQGMAILEEGIAELKGRVIPGDLVFKLYDTYGFPADLTADVARERGLTCDMAGFEQAMQTQRSRSSESAKFSASLGQVVQVSGQVQFQGYEATEHEAVVQNLFDSDGKPLDKLVAGDDGVLVLDQTPFYAESGGQVGDRGVIRSEGFGFKVKDTQVAGQQYIHIGEVVEGEIASGAPVSAVVAADRRAHIRRNHSATHLMHAALRLVLGDHVQQKGSLVDDARLRFDFSHPQALTADELAEIERIVNEQVLANSEVTTDLLSYDEAVERGAMALFGEKYGDRVRVLTMGGGYSVELCGGTHVQRTGDIGLFKIISETGIAADVRRIEAVTGAGALKRVSEADVTLRALSDLLKAGNSELPEKVASLLAEQRRLSKTVLQLENKLAAEEGADLANSVVEVAGVQVLAAAVPGGAKALMPTLDSLRGGKLQSGVVVLGADDGGKVNLVASVSKDLVGRIKAPELVNLVGADVGAKGGGRPEMARAGGGTKPEALNAALAQVASHVEKILS